MKKNIQILYWNAKIVGSLVDPKADNFDFYGAWEPTEDKLLYESFLAQIDEEGGAFVEIGSVGSPLTGTVEVEPDQEIEIKLRP